LDQRLAHRRSEKRELTEKVERLQKVDQIRPPVPTETWVDEQLRNLGEVLSQGTPAATHALRNLVGGQIVVTEIRRAGHERHHLQGRFTIRAAAIVRTLVGPGDATTPAPPQEPETGEEEIVIDFRQPQSTEESERAYHLYENEKWLEVRIAQDLGVSKCRVTTLLQDAYARRGQEKLDGRSRRSSLEQKHQVQPMFEALADPVESLLQEGLLIQEIAARLGCCKDTVTKVIQYLRTVRGLSIPDGRARRKSLDRKVSHPRRHPGDDQDSLTASG
jgi:transposase